MANNLLSLYKDYFAHPNTTFQGKIFVRGSLRLLLGPEPVQATRYFLNAATDDSHLPLTPQPIANVLPTLFFQLDSNLLFSDIRYFNPFRTDAFSVLFHS